MKRLTRLAPDRVSRTTLVWVLIAQAVSIVPLLFQLPFWVAMIWWTALIWRVQIFRGAVGFPRTSLKIVLGLACVGLIFASYTGSAGVEPMVGFLVCSFTLKLIEMHTQKDALTILFIAFIAIAAQFLFAQNVFAAVYGLFAFWVLIAAWRLVITKRELAWRHQLKVAAHMLVQSVPLLVVMFLIMPRLGPLWSVPLPHGKGTTGFGDSLELGDIGELVKSYELAFHVEFDGPPPKAESLYWRGLILDDFDGRKWQARSSWMFAKPNMPDGDWVVDLVDYSVILEPHHQQWLFSLGFPAQASSRQTDLRRTRTGLLNATRPVSQKIQYSVSSTLAFPPGDERMQRDFNALLAFPEQYNPRTQALARQWRAQGMGDQQVIDAALGMFRESFYYTLKPPTLGANSSDDFLFDTREGFCEHFASSFVLLMRAANIPARVVVGYQGGSFNPQGFLTVRQADAHAWSEVWLEGRGWVSIDPTAAVAPNRIRWGVEEALGVDDRELLASSHWQRRLLYRVQQRWDAFGYNWQRWVLNYDNDKKDAFLTRWLGGVSPWRVGLTFVGICVLVVAVIAASFWYRQHRKPVAEEDKIISPLLKRYAAMGYPRAPHEPLAAYFKRMAQVKPQFKANLLEVSDRYYAVKYRTHNRSMQPLRQAVANCS